MMKASTLLLLPSLVTSWVSESRLKLGSVSLRMRNENEMDSHRRKLERVFMQDLLDLTVFRVDDDGPSWDSSALDTCGEDCDECEIPEELKLLSDTQQLDVMTFLGIQRAKPLNVIGKRDNSVDWE